MPVFPGCRSALPFVRSLFFALLDHCRRWRSRDSNPGHSSSSQLSYCTISPVSPGCHVSTASRCPPASYGGQHSPLVFWPVNMAGTSCHGISLRIQISLAPGSGIPPAAAPSFRGALRLKRRMKLGGPSAGTTLPWWIRGAANSDGARTRGSRTRTDPYKGDLGLPGPEDLPRCGITPNRERRETRRPSDALEGWTGLEPVTTALQAVALPLRYHPMCPASAGREKRKERDHFPARAGRVVGQARIELTVSVVSKRMGDHTPLSHLAGLSRQSPPAW